MPVNVSEVYIANLALAELGSRAIVSLDDATPEARWCKRFYSQCRDELLRSHPWNFAIKRQTLSALPSQPLSEWLYQYALPSDFIRLYQLNSFFADERQELYQIEAGNLLTDAETASIRYIFQQTDTTKFDPLFVSALALLLASKVCRPITGNDGSGYYQQHKLIALPEARKLDAREDKPRVKSPMAESDLIRSRFASDVS